MAVAGEGPSLSTFLLDLSGGARPLALPFSQSFEGDREQGSQVYVRGSVWRKMRNLAFFDGGLGFREALIDNGWTTGAVPTDLPIGYPVDARRERILYIFQLPMGPGTGLALGRAVATIVVTTTDIYVENTGGWHVATSLYDSTAAGDTVTFNNGSTTVTGVGTLWANFSQNEKISPGWCIRLNNGAGYDQWHVVTAVTNNTTLTVNTAPTANGAGVTYQVRRCMGAQFGGTQPTPPSPSDNVFAVVFNGDLYVAASAWGAWGVSVVMLIAGWYSGASTNDILTTTELGGNSFIGTGDPIDQLGNITGLQVMQTGNVVITADTYTGQLSRAYYSSNLNPAVWNSAPGGFTDVVAGGASQVSALGRIGPIFTLHYPDGMSIANPTGQEDPPLSFAETRERGGSKWARTLITWGGYEYFLGVDGIIYRWSGNGAPEPMTDQHRVELRAVQQHREDASYSAYTDDVRREYVVVKDGKGYAVNVDTRAARTIDWGRPVSAASQLYMRDGDSDPTNSVATGTRAGGSRLVGFKAEAGFDAMAVMRDGFARDDNQWLLNPWGYGLRFNGTTSGGDAGNVYDVGAGDSLTMRVVYRSTNATATNEPVCMKGISFVAANPHYGFMNTAAGKTRVTVADGVDQVNTESVSNHNDGRTHEAWMRIDRAAALLKLRTDGVDAASASLAAVGSLSNASALRAGRTDTNFHACDIDEIAIWTRALTDAEVDARQGRPLAAGDADAYWPFDDGAGSVGLQQNQFRRVWGVFNGATSSASGGNIYNLADANAEITVRVFFLGTGIQDAFVARKNQFVAAFAGYGFHFSGSGTVVCDIADGVTQISVASAGVHNDGLWHEAWMRLDRAGQLLKVRVDGVDATPASTATLGSPSNAETFWHGRRGDGAPTAFFAGRMNEVAVWTRALSDAEVDARQGRPLAAGDADSYWKYADNAGAVAVDSEGFANLALTDVAWADNDMALTDVVWIGDGLTDLAIELFSEPLQFGSPGQTSTIERVFIHARRGPQDQSSDTSYRLRCSLHRNGETAATFAAVTKTVSLAGFAPDQIVRVDFPFPPIARGESWEIRFDCPDLRMVGQIVQVGVRAMVLQEAEAA